MTKYKKAILDIVNMSHCHMTIDDIYKKIKTIYPDVVLATVYNNVNSLVEEKLIHRLSIEGQVDRYDKIDKHDHLICEKCGKLIDIMFNDYTKDLMKQSGVDVIGYDLKVYVICDECKNKLNN